MVGRNGYHIKGVEAILRGYKSQNSNYYDAQSRNKQDIPNCIASGKICVLIFNFTSSRGKRIQKK